MFGFEGFGKNKTNQGEKAEFEIDQSGAENPGHNPYSSVEDQTTNSPFENTSMKAEDIKGFHKENPSETDPGNPIEPPAEWKARGEGEPPAEVCPITNAAEGESKEMEEDRLEAA